MTGLGNAVKDCFVTFVRLLIAASLGLVLSVSANSAVIVEHREALKQSPWNDRSLQEAMVADSLSSSSARALGVSAENNVAGQATRYTIAARVTLKQLSEATGGGLSVLFPSEFDLTHVSLVDLTVDRPGLTLKVARAVVAGQSLSVYLKASATLKKGDNHQDARVEIRIALDDPKNPPATGTYRVAACLFGANGSISGTFLQSGSVSIIPGPLSKIIMNLTPDQVVGNPFVGSAQIFLLDSNNNRKTDYDLSANPILLVSASGGLTPNLLNNPAFIDSGVINFQPASVRYSGPSGKIPLYATAGSLRSENVIVAFSGYELGACLNTQGAPVTQLYSGQPISLRVTASNNGALVATERPTLTAHVMAGGKPVVTSFAASSNGKVDTIAFDLPGDPFPTGSTALVLELRASYRAGDSLYSVSDRKEIPITVLSPVTLSVVPNSISPKAAYSGVDFPFSFDIARNGFAGPIDSSTLTLQLLSSGNPLTTIFQGSVTPANIFNDIIAYRDLVARIDSGVVRAGNYGLRFRYRLISKGTVFAANADVQNALTVLQRPQITYVANSLTPRELYAGIFNSFGVSISSSASENLDVKSGSAKLVITGEHFSASTDLIFPSRESSLVPGLNPVQTKGPFIPQDQLGESLSVRIEFAYRDSSSPVYLKFSTDCNAVRIPVVRPPTLQIIDVRSASPNDSRVNTGQRFQIACRVANLSPTRADSVHIRLASDGASSFESHAAVESVPGNDTVDVFHDVTAAREKNNGEIFSVELVSANAVILPPANNVTLVEIQDPARLALSYTLEQAAGEYVGFGETFGSTVSMANFGSAEVTEGNYRLETSGFDFPQPGPFEGIIDVRSAVAFNFRAPDHDARLTLRFVLTTRPLDVNTNRPAEVNDSAFTVSIVVASVNGNLEASAVEKHAVPVVVGSTIPLFVLQLTNHGASQFTDASLDRIVVRFSEGSDHALDMHDLIDMEATGFYDNNTQVSSIVIGADSAVLAIHSFGISHAATRTLEFRIRLIRPVDRGLRVRIDTGGIKALFVDGPLKGTPAPVVGQSNGLILDAGFASTLADFANAFMIKNNPYRPAEGPAQFNYFVDTPSAVDFRIVTLAGELVYERRFAEGTDGTAVGQHAIAWDGRNGNGDPVLNGVYVAMISLGKTGQIASLKVAVVR